MLPADWVYGLDDVIGQFYVVSVDAFVQLRYRGHANDGAGDAPFLIAVGERELHRREAMIARELIVQACGVECFGASPALAAGGFVAGQSCLRWCTLAGQSAGVVFAGEQTERERRVGQQRHAEQVHGFVEAVFVGAVYDGVWILDGGDAW